MTKEAEVYRSDVSPPPSEGILLCIRYDIKQSDDSGCWSIEDVLYTGQLKPTIAVEESSTITAHQEDLLTKLIASSEAAANAIANLTPPCILHGLSSTKTKQEDYGIVWWWRRLPVVGENHHHYENGWIWLDTRHASRNFNLYERTSFAESSSVREVFCLARIWSRQQSKSWIAAPWFAPNKPPEHAAYWARPPVPKLTHEQVAAEHIIQQAKLEGDMQHVECIQSPEGDCAASSDMSDVRDWQTMHCMWPFVKQEALVHGFEPYVPKDEELDDYYLISETARYRARQLPVCVYHESCQYECMRAIEQKGRKQGWWAKRPALIVLSLRRPVLDASIGKGVITSACNLARMMQWTVKNQCRLWIISPLPFTKGAFEVASAASLTGQVVDEDEGRNLAPVDIRLYEQAWFLTDWYHHTSLSYHTVIPSTTESMAQDVSPSVADDDVTIGDVSTTMSTIDDAAATLAMSRFVPCGMLMASLVATDEYHTNRSNQAYVSMQNNLALGNLASSRTAMPHSELDDTAVRRLGASAGDLIHTQAFTPKPHKILTQVARRNAAMTMATRNK